jgi:membrane-associated phospholipid phosphatase
MRYNIYIIIFLINQYKVRNMKTYLLKFLILAFLGICLVKQVYPQSRVSDSTLHPYSVNYWVSGTICVVGLYTNFIGIPKTLYKAEVTDTELLSLNKGILNGIDRWAVNQDPSQKDKYGNYSNYTLSAIVVLPALMLFDKGMRQDWLDLFIMYTEAISITSNIFEWSFLGPTFQNRFRPVTYYTQLPDAVRKDGNNRNSFYSGHVATVATTTFFMVKVYSDYHPEIGNNKYWLYGAATVPALIEGYLRVKALKHFPSDVMVGLGLGALVGIVIPEFHLLKDKKVTLGLYSSPDAVGIALNWQPNILK